MLLLLLLALPRPAATQADNHYVIRDVAPDVFVAAAPDGVPSYLFAASVVVIGDEGVLVVDSGQRPGLARQLIAHIRERTDRPVRWVVNTHWHGDHVWGNAAFRDAYPGVRILATPATRDSIDAASARQVEEQVQRERQARARLAALRDSVRSVQTPETPETPETSEASDADLLLHIAAADSVRAHRIRELEALEIVRPTGTFDTRTEIDLGGGRTAILLPLGPAHTPGDAAVWLPDSGVLAVGDLLEEGQLWLEGADAVGWLRALDALSALDPRVVIPSHGHPDNDGALLAAARQQLEAATGDSPAPQ